ncbi:MAG: serine/threonine-protein kinase RsbW [Solirubrobacteraceae bacterium]|nr:serine/threonine-protein kinase RsbW [Solirubrobacteraceae bacterium]
MLEELSIEVPRDERGPAQSRAALTDRFSGRISARRLEDLLLIVSELTTNALRHGAGRIRMRVRLDGGLLHGEVIDEGSGFARKVERRGIDAVGGNGLHMVGALARRWGIHEGSSHVWFELAPGNDPQPADPRLGAAQRPDALDD